jgi:hypothetical protein
VSLSLLDHALGDPELSAGGLDPVLAVPDSTGARALVKTTIERPAPPGARRLEAAAVAPAARRRVRELPFDVAGVRPSRPAAPSRCSGGSASPQRPACVEVEGADW